jgi:RalA-binding protein 1
MRLPKLTNNIDLIDSSARVAELSRLISDLPPPNYALLRALTAHLILIVANSHINKMTLRNIGIVFSPTLGIPAGIFSELVSHFGAIFDAQPEDANGVGEDGSLLGGSTEETEETVRRKRNSMLYQAGGADAMLGLTGRSLDPGLWSPKYYVLYSSSVALEDSASEISVNDTESEAPSVPSEDDLSAYLATSGASRAEDHSALTAR